ncbi:hypothetical protein BIU97_01580 [Curtobacterium sp. MCBA15_009]|uniref:LamG-like jellyroll fold domain-containing protein n=1 Tax=Curtobacterium sp. MCBA15_009 TaxID=1898737 RepID=UPI0008DCE4D5|nr:LamG-like jellyroll fold domain-containing protein [Curtobacterium sp. MCBA15_009]OII14180.1 hypothetical protein BIU97_01580 [Curtobacterium sp. MCBA15_009]
MPTTVTRRPVRCVGDLPRLLLAVAARTVLWSVLLLAVWASLPAALGWHVTTVVSDSMAPGIRTGDVVAAMPAEADAVEPGRVLLVDDPDHDDRLRLHRLERVEQDGDLRLRGDANPAADRTPVDPDAVLGIGVLRFPWVGLPGVWLRTGAPVPLLLTTAVAALLLAATRLDRDVADGLPCRRCGAPRRDLRSPITGEPGSARRPGSATGGAPPVVATVAALAAITAVSTLVAGAGFSGTTATASALGTETFPCFHRPEGNAVLAWDFAEKNGPRVTDSSGSGADGAFSSSSGSRVDGDCVANPYASFRTQDGLEGWAVTDTAVDAPNAFTIEVWFRTTDTGGGRVFGFGSDRSAASTHRDRHLYVDGAGRLRFGVEESGSQFKFTLLSSSVVTDGEWHHAVGAFQPRSMTLWLDGVQQGTRADAVTLRQYSGHWRVGRQTLSGWPAGAGFAYNGDVDTARVHDHAFTADEVAARFAAGR